MKSFPVLAIFALSCASAAFGDAALDQARKMEAGGDAAGARAVLAKAAQASPNDADAQAHYAEFLDRYGDPAARRLAILDLLAGDNPAASTDLDTYSGASGQTLRLPGGAAAQEKRTTVPIPGPM